jgi:dipeptidyl-peptidase-4
MKYKSSEGCLILVLSCHLLWSVPSVLGQTPLTRPEQSNHKATSLYQDVLDFLDETQRNATVDVMHWGFFGKTREGRRIPYVVLSKPMVTRSDHALASRKPIVFIMNNIHGGETDGKEASLMLIRDITHGRFSHWLDSMILLIVPIYNIDGNERVGKYNRMGQVGPEAGMGIRTNAAGFDLARDYMKVEQPEGKALASLFKEWWPHFTIDAHTNDGSYHDFAIEYAYPQNANVQPIIVDYLKNKMMPTVSRHVEKKSGYKSQVYGTFVDEYHPEKGWETYPSFPRYGDRYRGLQNRLSILIESYPYTDFKSRITATYQFFIGCLDYAADHTGEIIDVVREAEERTILAGNTLGADSIGVRFGMVEDDKKVNIISFKIKQEVNEEGMTSYRRTKEMTTYTVPYFGKSIATKKVARPYAYIIPRAYETIAYALKQHGIVVEELRLSLQTAVEAYRVTERAWAEETYQGHRTVQLTAEPETRSMTFAPGTYIVRLAQSSGNVAAFLLEPETPDGYAYWNRFDQIGEQTVIIVDDFLDTFGGKLLEKPEVRAEFDKLAERDPQLRSDPEKRRQFFLSKSPYADSTRNIFPVYRLMSRTGMATTILREEE